MKTETPTETPVTVAYSGQLHITKFELIDLWECGILGDVAYVYLALKMDRSAIESTNSIDVDLFCQNWQGTGTGLKAPKELKEATLRKALVDIQKKEKISLGDRQLQLEFMD